jgi:hypothetical protein
MRACSNSISVTFAPQNFPERGRGHPWGLAVARAMIAAPRADHLRLTPADDAAFKIEAQHDIAFADARAMAYPMMRASNGQRDQEDFAAPDFQTGHRHSTERDFIMALLSPSKNSHSRANLPFDHWHRRARTVAYELDLDSLNPSTSGQQLRPASGAGCPVPGRCRQTGSAPTVQQRLRSV